jgi:uncharacterized protein with von Willebrand factor type A (vWA) domain
VIALPARVARPGPDLATVCAEFAALLGAAGVFVPVQRICWWAEATIAAGPTDVTELYWLARVTLLDRSDQLDTFDAVFGQVFRGLVDVADFRGDPANSLTAHTEPGAPSGAGQRHPDPPAERDGDTPQQTAAAADSNDDESSGDDGAPTVLAIASETELLRDRDFADCDADELAELAKIIARMQVVAPVRPSRWEPTRRSGRSLDMRRTLRAACRTGGDPIRWSHRRRGTTPRKIVLLADVSGSMQAYSRVYLRILQGAVLGARAHAYVFATRLHPVTRALGRGRREDAIGRAMAMSPDASGGTRIGGAVKAFLDTDGRRGLARGAVVVIVSDGWERADPALLGEQMGRLSRLAHRVIWVNPRKAAPGFAPLTGGMAAALPHVDTFVSGHSARSVAELLDAIASG